MLLRGSSAGEPATRAAAALAGEAVPVAVVVARIGVVAAWDGAAGRQPAGAFVPLAGAPAGAETPVVPDEEVTGQGGSGHTGADPAPTDAPVAAPLVGTEVVGTEVDGTEVVGAEVVGAEVDGT